MAQSKVEIWNRALSRIGVTKRVEDENASDLAAGQCRLHYDACLREALEGFAWPFALKQTTLQLARPVWDKLAVYAIDDEVTYERRRYKSLVEPNLAFIPGASASAAYWSEMGPWFSGWENVYTLPLDFVSALALVPEGTRAEQLTAQMRVPFELMANIENDGLVLCTDGAQDGDFDVLEYVALLDSVPMMPDSFAGAVAWRLAAELALSLKQDRVIHDDCYKRYMWALTTAKTIALNGRTPDRAPTTGLVAAQGRTRLPDRWRR